MSRWLDYRDPSTEPWWVDVLLVGIGIVVFLGITATS